MAAELIWSSDSLDDIHAVAQLFARDSGRHAQRVVDGLLELGNIIIRYPLAGRTVPQLGDAKVREQVLYSYRVIYEIGHDRVGSVTWRIFARVDRRTLRALRNAVSRDHHRRRRVH